MQRMIVTTLMTACVLLAGWFPSGPAASQAQALNPSAPSAPVRLVFIHHSVGQNWLNDNLFAELNTNNYFITDTYYGWTGGTGDDIGGLTDIGHWHNWFLGPSSPSYLAGLYNNTYIYEPLTNSMPQPAGPNTVVLFKSCFPNSGGISGNPGDPPRISSYPGDPNPIWGATAYDTEVTTVSNIKGLYRDLLSYFATRQDKLFILITPPPVRLEDQAVEGSSDLARAINNWLINHWLDDYPYNNVAVFDFFNGLTSNNGDVNTNDLGAAGGNHHRLVAGQVQHQVLTANNYCVYSNGDASHPTAAGNAKATGEFLPLLNIAYHAWQGTGGRPLYMGRSSLPPSLTLTSAAFPNGGRIPDRYTLKDGTGRNISIPLAWANVPPGTLSFALSMVDRLPAANNWVHWLAVNIPAATTSLAEGASATMPAGTIQLNNSWGWTHYGGPYPPYRSGNHPYEITVYALNTASLPLPVDTDLAAFEAALAGRVLGSASITGYYTLDFCVGPVDVLLLD